MLVACCLAGPLAGQGYLLDEGERPASIYYEVGGQERAVGTIDYTIYLPDGRPMPDDPTEVAFGGAPAAGLVIQLHVRFDRPNARRIRNLRVEFPPELLNAVRGQTWEIDNQRSRPEAISLQHDDRVRLHYTYDRPGPVSFLLPFAVVPVGTAYSGDGGDPALRRNRIVSPQVTVRNLLTEEEAFWRRKKGEFDGVVAYLRTYPRGVHTREANQFFARTINADYDRLVERGSAGSAAQFVDRYQPYVSFSLADKLVASARQRSRATRSVQGAAAPARRSTRPVRERPIRANVGPALGPVSGNKERSYTLAKQADGTIELQFANFDRPVYHDVYGGLLDIDDRQLVTDHVLRVTPLSQRPVHLLVVERGREEKFVTVPLDNSLRATLRADSVSRVVKLDIVGGTEPFAIYLRPMEEQAYDWGVEGSPRAQAEIPVYELQRSGLAGNYAVQVTGRGGAVPYTLPEPLYIPPPPADRSWMYPLTLALGLGLLALLLFFLLQRTGRSGRRRRPQNSGR